LNISDLVQVGYMVVGKFHERPLKMIS